MGIIRNSIHITGITPEDELPKKIKGQLIEYSEVEHIYIPEEKPKLGNIHQITIDLETISHRLINAPTGKIIVLDGIKKLKIIYSHKGYEDRVNIANIKIPFNTFIEFPKDSMKVEDISIHIVDAYFTPVQPRKLYSYTLYMVNVTMPKNEPTETFHHNVNATTSGVLNSNQINDIYINDSRYQYDEKNILKDAGTYFEE